MEEDFLHSKALSGFMRFSRALVLPFTRYPFPLFPRPLRGYAADGALSRFWLLIW